MSLLSPSQAVNDTTPIHPLENTAAPGVPYYTPFQSPPPGTAIVTDPSKPLPKLFTPLKIRGLELQNRIVTSPMCQYSADDGHLTPWHLAHLGGILTRGPGLVFVEATAVLLTGRISPQDTGIWSDSHVTSTYGLKSLVAFAHSQSQKIGIQLSHAGRKSSIVADWVALATIAPPEVGGWDEDVKSASAIAYGPGFPVPKEMTASDIEEVKEAHKLAVRRAVAAGFDTVEIQAAHGYLVHNFLSPISNIRTDNYGGSFENRVRLLLEIVELARAEMPASMPLFVRISATDWLENHPSWVGKETWTLDQSIKLAHLLADRGVDVIDVSSGGNHPDQQIVTELGYQVPFAKAIKETLVKSGKSMLAQTVGRIKGGAQAEAVLSGKGEKEFSKGAQELDLVAAGYSFLLNPGLVLSWAGEVGVDVSVVQQMS